MLNRAPDNASGANEARIATRRAEISTPQLSASPVAAAIREGLVRHHVWNQRIDELR